ncbi:zinc finger, CCHC-type containing protein [Tanacetum coccineum]
MASMNTRLNIQKLDGNIVQKHGGSKQVGFKQLGPSVEIGVHGLHDEKRVWFEVELQGAQGDREAEVFQVGNDDTAVAQTRLEDKSTQQCMKSGVAKYLGVAVIQQHNGLVKETNVTLLAKVHCFLIQSGLSKVLWAEDTTMSTYLVNRSPSSAIGFKTPIDMLGFFCWLASIKNMGFNESGKYKKTFIGSGVEPHGNVDQELFSYREDNNEDAFAVVAVDKIYAHESLTFNNTVACEVISKWKAGLKYDMDAPSDVYVLSNGCRKCSDDNDVYYW